MHGSINFESEEDKGSRFEVRLPFELNAAIPETTNVDEQTGRDDHPDRLNQANVLIVDDNDVNRLVLKTFLDPYHIQYSEASSGTEAMQQLKTGKFNIVLLDINMPDMSGFEVREQYCHTKVSCPQFVAVTAHAFEEEIDHILDAGFDECLIKPISEAELIGMLKWLSAAF